VSNLSETALIIVDMQLGNFQGAFPIRNGSELVTRVRSLIDRARHANFPVVFVVNRGSKGDPDEYGTDGWKIHPEISPLNNEKVIEKTTPDAFHETGLQEELENLDVSTLIIAGLQTEYCIDTTCRRASLLGFDVVLVSDAHSTWNSRLLTADKIIAHHNEVLSGWFVRLSKTSEIVFA
jgi:nicotinamidase-related amidase